MNSVIVLQSGCYSVPSCYICDTYPCWLSSNFHFTNGGNKIVSGGHLSEQRDEAWRGVTDCEGNGWRLINFFLAHDPWYSKVLSPRTLVFRTRSVHPKIFGFLDVWGMIWLGLFPRKLVNKIKIVSLQTHSFWIVFPSDFHRYAIWFGSTLPKFCDNIMGEPIGNSKMVLVSRTILVYNAHNHN